MATPSTFSFPLHVSLILAAGLIATVNLHGQGALVPPPGAPAPTMKSLDQVEARTIVNATNTPGDATNTFIISVPGSYYLTGNITGASGKNGISVLANNVTLDLNGFTLIGGGGGATRGVNTTTALTNFRIRNGSVSGWTGGGVRADLAVAWAEKLSLADCTGAAGLTVGNGSMITDCVASGNGTGFFCADRTQISNCIATVNTGVGFDCQSYVTIIDCTASRNFGAAGIRTLGSCSIIRCSATRNIPAGNGISAGPGCTIADCAANNNLLDGIVATSGSSVRGCMTHENGFSGITVFSDCHVTGNTCSANSATHTGEGAGIAVWGDRNRIDGNTCTSNLNYGIYLRGSTAGNLLIRNFSTGHPTIALVPLNYSLGSSLNGTAIVIAARGSDSISSASPWANFSD